jgi:hypothetical protein
MPDLSTLANTLKKRGKLSLSLPFLRYEMDLRQIWDSRPVDQRIAQLDLIRADLTAAVDAVAELQREAQDNKREAERFREAVEHLEQDKVTAETLLKVPEDSFTRLLIRANSKARIRGLLEGIIVGFATGVLSSYLVAYLTK